MRKCDIPATIADANSADLSEVQELRTRLIREGYYGEHEERQLTALSRAIIAGMDLDTFDAEVLRRFGPWPKPPRDAKGRVVWSRREINEVGDVVRGAVVSSDRTVIA